MFSPEQYQALREGAGLVERASRGQLILAGADRLAFLQGLLTNDVAALTAGAGCYAALLTAHGRMITDLRVFETGSDVVLDLDRSRTSAICARLDASIFSEDARVSDASAEHTEVGVYGPLAAASIVRAAGESGSADAGALGGMPLYANTRVTLAGEPCLLMRSDEIGVAGFDVLAPAASADRVRSALRAAGCVEVSGETADVTRVEGGRPLFGVDMGEDTIPLEAGIEDRAISLTKGCYVGQEIIIRILHRGHGRVAKRLVGLSFEPGSRLPARGDKVRAGDRDTGEVTSVARSPALDRPVALAYVHRDASEPGTQAVVGTDRLAATVAALPFVPTARHQDADALRI